MDLLQLQELIASQDPSLEPLTHAIRNGKYVGQLNADITTMFLQEKKQRHLLEQLLMMLLESNRKSARFRNRIRWTIMSYDKRPELQKLFWSVAEDLITLAYRPGDKHISDLHAFRRSLLAEVAVQRASNAVGGKFSFAKAQDDKHSAIDGWIGKRIAVQITSYLAPLSAQAVSVDIIAAEQASPADFSRWQHDYKWASFQRRLREYSLRTGHECDPLMLIIPSPMFDQVTGQPETRLVEQLAPILTKPQA